MSLHRKGEKRNKLVGPETGFLNVSLGQVAGIWVRNPVSNSF